MLNRTESRLPPLNALRAFEAAARHLSMKEAAEELRVTPGAVSQLVRGLEAHLGLALFRRLNRGLMLTEAGQAYLPPLRNAFRQIAEATRRIEGKSDTGLLTLSVAPGFAASWLVPRLARFRQRHPAIELHIRSTSALADFHRDGVDVAIRHGRGRYPGLRSDRILSQELLPVASPSLLHGRRRPRAPADLLRLPLLHDADRQDWSLWLQAQGIDEIGPPAGPSFDDSTLLVRAALAGQGAALLPSALVLDEIADGRLLRLVDAPLPSDFAYYCVSPKETADRPKIAAFRDWLLEEAEVQPTDPGAEIGRSA
jgi:LysR family transcriptional regulator, glycine cleavage system transcriptional activator